jgi:Na+-transporting methylmalonyl-CoA/oxaloacetate decarboxylase gamma subunit
MANIWALERGVEIVPKFTGAVSIVASTFVARHITTTKKWREISLTNMMMFYISVVDIITSFFVYFMSSWMAPPPTRIYAAGTTATCTAQGFFNTFSLAYFSTAYTQLAVLYWLIVRHGWTKKQMEKKRIRLSFLLPPLLVALCFSVPPLFFQLYNPFNFICSINAFPGNCNDDDIPCTRGSAHSRNVSMILLSGYMLLGNTAVFLFMGLLICTIYKQEKKSDSYLTEGQEKNRKNTKSTAWQGVRFSAAYFVPYVIHYVNFVWSLESLGGMTVVFSDAANWFAMYWLAIVTPLLGAFNSVVYFYPRYTMHRKANSDKSRMTCLCEVLGLDTSRCHCERRGTNAASETISTASTPLISEEDIQAIL